MEHLLDTARLTCWGTGILVVWLSVIRLGNMAWMALAWRWPRLRPVMALPPMQVLPDWLVALSALCGGIAAFIAFFDYAAHIPVLHALMGDHLSPGAQMVRFVLAQEALTAWLLMVAMHPRWKLGWVAGWCLFSFLVTAC